MSEARLPSFDPEQFWKYVDKSDGCWGWTGSKNEHGYGSIRLGGRSGRLWKAHRVSYILATGDELNSSDHICHHCDNPPCVNPAHLYKGNYRTNTDDKLRRGRQPRGPELAAILAPSLPRGDEHWTRRHPELINREAMRGRVPWNKGQLSQHGTQARYSSGCRCADCTEARRITARKYR